MLLTNKKQSLQKIRQRLLRASTYDTIALRETGANTVKTGLDAAHSQARGAISCATNCLQRETLNPVRPMDSPPVTSPSLHPRDTSRLCFTLQKAHVAFSPLASCGVHFIAPILSKVSVCWNIPRQSAPRRGRAETGGLGDGGAGRRSESVGPKALTGQRGGAGPRGRVVRVVSRTKGEQLGPRRVNFFIAQFL